MTSKGKTIAHVSSSYSVDSDPSEYSSNRPDTPPRAITPPREASGPSRPRPGWKTFWDKPGFFKKARKSIPTGIQIFRTSTPNRSSSSSSSPTVGSRESSSLRPPTSSRVGARGLSPALPHVEPVLVPLAPLVAPPTPPRVQPHHSPSSSLEILPSPVHSIVDISSGDESDAVVPQTPVPVGYPYPYYYVPQYPDGLPGGVDGPYYIPPPEPVQPMPQQEQFAHPLFPPLDEHYPDLYEQYAQANDPQPEEFVHEPDPGVLYAEELTRRVVMEHRLYNRARDLVRVIIQRDLQISAQDHEAVHARSRAARDGEAFRGHAMVALLSIVELDDMIRQTTCFGPPTRAQCDQLRQRAHKAVVDIMMDQDRWVRHA